MTQGKFNWDIDIVTKAEDAKGFIKVTSTPLRVYYNNHKDEEI